MHPRIPALLLAAFCCLAACGTAVARPLSFGGQGCWVTMEIPSGWSASLKDNGRKLSMVEQDTMRSIDIYPRRMEGTLETYARKAAATLSSNYTVKVTRRNERLYELVATGRGPGLRVLVIGAKPGVALVFATNCDEKTTGRMAKCLTWR